MKKFSLLDVVASIIILLPVVYLLWAYTALPALVPIHYGFNGKPDAFGSKKEFLNTQIIVHFVAIALYLLFRFLPFIDPKRQVKYGGSTYQKMALGIIVFFGALNISVTYAAAHRVVETHQLIMPLIGLLFVFLGNIMNSIKPNYFAGIRTPWTLEDDNNWRATHRMAAKLYVVGGIIATIAILVLPEKAGVIIFAPCIISVVFIPIVYSYVYFKKHKVN